jgi:DNA-binding MarR family transcriptional regulator
VPDHTQPDPVQERVGYALKRAQQALGTAMAAALAGHGVTNAQYAALSALQADPGLSNAELARRSFVTPQTMHEVIAQLERAGLVARQADPHHARILQRRLTRRGEEVLAACHQEVLAIEQRMLAPLRPSQQAQLGAWLTQCVQALTGNGM